MNLSTMEQVNIIILMARFIRQGHRKMSWRTAVDIAWDILKELERKDISITRIVRNHGIRKG